MHNWKKIVSRGKRGRKNYSFPGRYLGLKHFVCLQFAVWQSFDNFFFSTDIFWIVFQGSGLSLEKNPISRAVHSNNTSLPQCCFTQPGFLAQVFVFFYIFSCHYKWNDLMLSNSLSAFHRPSWTEGSSCNGARMMTFNFSVTSLCVMVQIKFFSSFYNV